MSSSTKRKYDLDNDQDLAEVQNLLLNDDDETEELSEEISEDGESDAIEESEQDSVSESDENDDSNSDGYVSDNPDFYQAVQKKRGKIVKTFQWKKTPYHSTKRARQNIVVRLPGVIGKARDAKTPLETWKCFFDDQILDQIVMYTNQYIEAERNKFARKRDAPPTDAIEVRALLGLLYLAGVYRANRLNLTELWDTSGHGIEIFRLTMNLRRFSFLLKCLRFDDKDTRIERKALDRLAPVREMFELFVQNCKANYSLGLNVTIDEKLESFRGRCSFKQYIPSKPAKYGIKIFAMVDSKLWYTHNMEIYPGKQPEGSPFQLSNKPSDVVERLCTPIFNTGRNVTMDNWFNSIDLAEKLLEKKLSMVGTLKKNKPQIPPEFKNIYPREVNSSLFGFSQHTTIVSYIPKPKKNVILISSMHHEDAIDLSTGEKCKPEIITYYNSTKGGVDTNDELCSTYNVARNVRRWPMVIFFCLLNVAGINSQIVYIGNGNQVKSRRKFLRNLADELIQDHLVRRQSTAGIHVPLMLKIKKQARKNLPTVEEAANVQEEIETEDQGDKRKRCYPCQGLKKTRLTKYFCSICKTNLCLQHCKMICDHCIPK